MRVIIIISFFLFFSVQNFSQLVQQQWVSRYNNQANLDDRASCIAVDSLGNVYVSGSSEGIGTDYDYLTIKYNNSGVQEWLQRYDGPNHGLEQVHSMAIDKNGNVYVTGRSCSGHGTGCDYATVKYNTNGIQQWVQRYDCHDDDEAYSIAIDDSGNVYITGECDDGTNRVISTIKYNTNGIPQWNSIYSEGIDQNIGYSIFVDNYRNVYVTGETCSGYCHYITIKYNSSGVQQWARVYSTNSIEYAYKVVVDNNSNVYVTGMSLGSVNYDYVTVKYNPEGVQQWIARYNGPANDYDHATSIAVDGMGNVFVTGYSIGIGSGYDYATIKYNSSGVQQWVQRYDGPADSTDIAYAIALDSFGNVYVTGYSRAAAYSGWGDYATIKYNNDGVQQWIQRYNGTGDSLDGAQAIALDNSGNVYVTGYSIGIGTNYDYATIKYSQPNGIKLLNENVPTHFSLSQNYPNPFNPTTKIKFSIPSNVKSETSNVKLIVFDILGNEIATLVNDKLSPGTYEVEFNAGNFASGVYFYRLQSRNFNETRKMVLMK